MTKLYKILFEGQHVYHNSTDPNIEYFAPRKFMHNPDYSESGKYIEGEEIPEGMEVSELVFATDENMNPFYSLPRDIPRVMVDDYESIDAILRAYPSLRGVVEEGKQNLLLDLEDMDAVQNYSWAQYAFDKDEYRFRPASDGEHVTNQIVKPVSVTWMTNPLEVIKQTPGWKVTFVPDLKDLHRMLTNSGLPYNAENLG